MEYETSRNPHELARRRQRAVAVYRKGQSPSTIAAVLGFDRSSVHRWARLARSPGALDPKPLLRPHGLSDAKPAELERLLAQGATRHGWATDLGIAALIRRRSSPST